MHSFIIASKNLEKGIGEAKKISTHEKVDFFDFEILDFVGFGIEDVRKIQQKIFLKPFKGDKKSLVIVIKDSITIEAQNSMLKLLEEPPQSSLIFIIIENHLSLLPTVLSRAKIIKLKDERESNDENLNQIIQIKSDGDALSLAQNVSKDKALAILWLENLIFSARDKMLGNLENKRETARLRQLIHEVELSHYDLKNTNANPRLVLENLFLNLYIK